METKEIIFQLRTKNGLSQDELAQKVLVTRQAVSRWENGETVPNTETLKLLSREFGVSINTLLGAPRQLICQCCGMPLEDDSLIGHDSDGALNENYCKWCYADGTYTYSNMDDLIDVCVRHMVSDKFSEEQARLYMKDLLPKLDYWKRYDMLSDNGQFEEFKKQLIREINALHIDGLPKVEKLNALVGKYVNLAYPLPNGRSIQFLNDETTYLGNELESQFGGSRCFGILANMDFILVCTYEAGGANPELVLYKKRYSLSCTYGSRAASASAFIAAPPEQRIDGRPAHTPGRIGPCAPRAENHRYPGSSPTSSSTAPAYDAAQPYRR